MRLAEKALEEIERHAILAGVDRTLRVTALVQEVRRLRGLVKAAGDFIRWRPPTPQVNPEPVLLEHNAIKGEGG